MRPRSLQNADVRVLLSPSWLQIRLKMPTSLHRHRLSPTRNKDRGHLERHGKDPSYYDTSVFPKDHPLHSQKNKKVIGKMKDECAVAPISEVVCLHSKMYSILLENDKNIKKAKGTTKVVTKKEILHQHHKDALFNKFAFNHRMDMLRSKDHQIYGVHLNKTTQSIGSKMTASTR